MLFDNRIILDFLSPLAVLVILALGYGFVWQRFSGAFAAPVALGLMFGCVAVLQMYAPIQPIEGLIIDLRTVPVALSGAFLGARGLAACLVVAMAARYHIGGIGMGADLLEIAIAGAVGLAWDRATRHRVPRGMGHFAVLGAAMSVSLGTGLLLPPPLASWFMESAAPMLFVLNLITVPAIAALLERERRLCPVEAGLAALRSPAMGQDMMTEDALLRDIAGRRAAWEPTGDDPFPALLVVRLLHRHWLTGHWGAPAIPHILSGLRQRLSGLVQHRDLVAITDDGALLVALGAAELAGFERLSVAIRRAVAERAFALPGGNAARVAVSVEVVPLAETTSADDIAACLAAVPPPGRAANDAQDALTGLIRPKASSAAVVDDGAQADLFARTAALLDRRKT